MKQKLDLEILIKEAVKFSEEQGNIRHESLVGVTDGKAVGTYFEQSFKEYLFRNYDVDMGNSARGIDLPEEHINTDIKVTSFRQPQSSSPFIDAKQKIFGLGYNLLVFVYDKDDNNEYNFKILNTTFIEKEKTSDFTITKRLIEMIKDGANKDDIVGYLYDKNIPGDDITLNKIAEDVLSLGIQQGYLTVSNALQWRLQYSRVIALNNKVQGVFNNDFY